MARGQGVQAVAEGVETMEQGDMLRSLGRRNMQGYLYGRPALFLETLLRLSTEDYRFVMPRRIGAA